MNSGRINVQLDPSNMTGTEQTVHKSEVISVKSEAAKLVQLSSESVSVDMQEAASDVDRYGRPSRAPKLHERQRQKILSTR